MIYAHSANDINLPVLPPIRPSTLLALCATPLIAGPADDVTFESPSEAFDWIFDADSLVFEVALEATSCVEAFLRGACRPKSRVCRSIKRGVAVDDIEKGSPKVN